MKKTTVFLLFLFIITALPYDSRAITVWLQQKNWCTEADFVIYNNTVVSVNVSGNDDWYHKGLYGDISPYSSKMDPAINVKHSDDNKGNLYLKLTPPGGEECKIKIGAENHSGETFFVMYAPDSNWHTATGEVSTSGAVAIHELSPQEHKLSLVSQMWNEEFVLTFFANNNVDEHGAHWTGNTKIILLINTNDSGKFTGGDERKVHNDKPAYWY